MWKTATNFVNQKTSDTHPTPNKFYFHQYISFIKIHCPPCAVHSAQHKFECLPNKPKQLNLTNSLLVHYPWPKQIQKDPQDLFIQSWTETRAHSSALAACKWFVWVIHVSVAQNWPTCNWCNLLKSPKYHKKSTSFVPGQHHLSPKNPCMGWWGWDSVTFSLVGIYTEKNLLSQQTGFMTQGIFISWYCDKEHSLGAQLNKKIEVSFKKVNPATCRCWLLRPSWQTRVKIMHLCLPNADSTVADAWLSFGLRSNIIIWVQSETLKFTSKKQKAKWLCIANKKWLFCCSGKTQNLDQEKTNVFLHCYEQLVVVAVWCWKQGAPLPVSPAGLP